MIEAIPLSSESIVLLVTKVESPDELDTRFSRFSECDDEFDDDDVDSPVAPVKPFNEAAADDILNIFNSLIEKAQEAIKASPEKAAASEPRNAKLDPRKTGLLNFVKSR